MSSDTFLGGFKVRCIEPRDLPVVKKLHEEFFPVRYQDEFYDFAVQGVGMRGMPLYSRIIITDDASEEIVGFVLAQFLDTEFCEERSLFYGSVSAAPSQLFYILTLGVKQEYRNRGLATALVEGCSEYACANLECGLVYLHVITYNESAIRLYKSCNFQHLRTLKEFYNIDNKPYDSYLYGKYVNNYSGDVIESFASLIRNATISLFSTIYSVLTGFMSSINVNLIGSVDDVVDPASTSLSDTGKGRRKQHQDHLGVDVDVDNNGNGSGDNASNTALV